MSELGRRVIVAVIAIPLTVGAVLLGELPLALFLGAFSGVGAWELYRMAQARGVHALVAFGVPLAASIPLVVHLTRYSVIGRPVAAGAAILVALFGVVIWERGPDERPLESIAVTIFGVLYTGGTLAFAYALRHHPWTVGMLAGATLLFYPVVLTWLVDIGAYAFGRMFGKKKLMPSVSPGKTVAGAVGGSTLAVAGSVGYSLFVLAPNANLALTWWSAIAFGLVVSAAAQIGDLAESLLKREAGMKDSGHLLPGHGGVLDRVDSLFFVLPVAYVFLSGLLVAAP